MDRGLIDLNYCCEYKTDGYLAEGVDLLEDVESVAVIVEKDLLADLCVRGQQVQLDQHRGNWLGD